MELYTKEYVTSNIKPAGGRDGPSVAERILKFLETDEEAKKGFIDAKSITNALEKNPVQINQTLKKLREANKIDFMWVKSRRSERSLVVYRHPKFKMLEEAKVEATKTETLKPNDESEVKPEGDDKTDKEDKGGKGSKQHRR